MEPLYLIVAYDRNRLIGKDGGLPWRYPEDLKYFKHTTMGHPIIHGRKSYEDVGKPLPGRPNIILTRQLGYEAAGCAIAHNLDQALRLAQQYEAVPFILGGAVRFREALPRITRLYVTEIDAEHEGDTYFPEIDESAYTEIRRRSEGLLTFRVLDRRRL